MELEVLLLAILYSLIELILKYQNKSLCDIYDIAISTIIVTSHSIVYILFLKHIYAIISRNIFKTFHI